MNLPRRPSGRRDRNEAPAQPPQADRPDHDPAHGDPGHAAYMSWVATTVSDHGWAISGRHGDQAAPPWAYTVGMWLTCRAPELVLCGLPVENAAAIINVIGERSADGADFGPDDVLRDVCPAPLTFRPVDPSWRETDGLLPISDSFYGMVRPPYLQVLWSDRNDRFPGEHGFQREFDRLQPLLWLPHDDNPPSAWTRLDALDQADD